MDVLAITGDEVRRLLSVEALVDALAPAFVSLSAGAASVPPRVACANDSGLLAAMPGFVPGAAMSVKLVSVFAGNHALGLPSHQAVIVVFSPDTGAPLAVMDGTHITAVRTAATSALAARALARPDARVLAILGAGVQGAAHLDALPRVLPVTSVRVASRSFAHASALAALDPRAVAVASFEEATRGADVVCCCTDSPSPVLQRAWLADGAHVSSVGASRAGPELDADTVSSGDVFVESRVAVQPYPAGAHELQGRDAESVTELGEVLAGTRPGRRGTSSLTVWKSMGHAIEDAVAAGIVLSAAAAAGAGRTVTL
jgi:ornithine cyclodeaminase/alanine dehydrogenase-like protein (mu-crystallin family)